MKSFKSFSKHIFDINNDDFEAFTLELFQFQAKNNWVYHQFVKNIGIDVNKIKSIEQIPFLPISFFKTQEIKTGKWTSQTVFQSSGTTGQVSSKHHVRDVAFYVKNTVKIFEHFYGSLKNYHFLALLPSYLERDNSSLVLMANHFIKSSLSEKSGFFLNDLPTLIKTIEKTNDDRQIVLLGVSFALLDLAENFEPDLSKCIVMETGGMKGRRKELIRNELHKRLMKGLNVSAIHSEYGMTELMSQSYSQNHGIFQTPPWMRVYFRDLNDPFDINASRSSGGINVIDLANVDSCSFIETQDIGKKCEKGGFEVIGRFDNADVRGCNLMVY